jgi:hypothetical protein
MSDAIVAAKRGLSVVRRFNGTVEEGMVSEVNGVRIELPWMLVDKERLLWVRAQTGIQYTLNHLRPMMLNINGVRRTDVDIYSIITDQHVSGGPSKKAESTSVYKMAQRFAAGDRSASKGRHCSRCAYLSICPSIS